MRNNKLLLKSGKIYFKTVLSQLGSLSMTPWATFWTSYGKL